MTYLDIRAALARERQNTLLADAEAARIANWLSFGRIIDVPFENCVAGLESWQRTGQGGELRIGHGLLRWPIKYDRDCGTYQIAVGLARGPLRPWLHMGLEINCWSSSFARTALELIPCQRVRPTAAYFRSGHLLMDSLTDSLRQWTTASRSGVPSQAAS